MNNLEIFRNTSRSCFPGGTIDSAEEFRYLSNHLCDCKLLHPQEVKRLIAKLASANSAMAFPISLEQFQQIIMNEFCDKSGMELQKGLKDIQRMLRDTKGILAVWKYQGLSEKERLELQAIFQKGNCKMKELLVQLQAQKDELDSICEQEIQMIKALDQWVQMQGLKLLYKDYHDYQHHHTKLTDDLLNRHRVREVHFKKKIITSKLQTITHVVALDSKSDQPVMVALIPKKMFDLELLNKLLVTYNARKELGLSQHFPKFLGYNTQADPCCFQYFSEYSDGRKLGDLIASSKIALQEQTPIFKYWVGLIYQALYDAYLMCSYQMELPLSLNHFSVSCNGFTLRLTCAFLQKRQQMAESARALYEADLLVNLGRLILDLLRVSQQQWPSSQKFKIQTMSLVDCLLHAVEGHKNYPGKVDCKLCFFNMQAHPLLESKHHIDGELIMSNFIAMLQ